MKELVVSAWFLICIGCSASMVTPDSRADGVAVDSPARILFVGNSYLYYGDSLHNHVRRLATELGPHPEAALGYKSATIGGARLSQHNLDHLLEPGHLGLDESFEVVILQAGSSEPLTDEGRAGLQRTAIALNKQIRATGARVALYMTPAYVPPHERFAPDMIDSIAQTYVGVGNKIGAMVIPVGLAFAEAYLQRPDIKLHKPFDGSHPSLLGTYLAACVVYESLYETSIIESSYDYFGAIPTDDAAFLRRIAHKVVLEFEDSQHKGAYLDPTR